jgi:hypothetical protein
MTTGVAAALAVGNTNTTIAANGSPPSSKGSGSPPSISNNNTSVDKNASTAASSGSSNRLQFNRLANERKTVHVMSANINKDVTKRDRQILASYNHAAAGAGGAASPNNNGGTTGANTLANHGVGTNLTNMNFQHQHYLNNNDRQATLDYNMTTGRSHTNASSFLQKLSSKFSRR